MYSELLPCPPFTHLSLIQLNRTDSIHRSMFSFFSFFLSPWSSYIFRHSRSSHEIAQVLPQVVRADVGKLELDEGHLRLTDRPAISILCYLSLPILRIVMSELCRVKYVVFGARCHFVSVLLAPRDERQTL